MIEKIAKAINSSDDILLIAHITPDGDTLGSTCALYGALKALGKRVVMACDSKVPDVYSFLPFADEMKDPGSIDEAKCAVAVDCADLKRLGALEQAFLNTPTTINIDHHITNEGFAALSWIEPSAASTGMQVFELIKALGVGLDRELALCVFVAISTDTGHFRYSNTSRAALLAAAELVDYNLNIPEITNRLYSARSFMRTKLLGLILSHVELFDGGALGVSCVTRQEMDECGGAPDMEGMVEFLRDIDTVETAILLREKEKNVIRVSMRSKRSFDVGALAGRFGGGGHQRAAGCTIEGGLNEVKDLLVKTAIEAMNEGA